MNTNRSRQGGTSNSRTPDRFCPSEKQLDYLTACQDADYGIAIKAACTEAGIGRQTYYEWMKSPGFKRWWLGAIEDYFIGALPGIYAELFKIAQHGAAVGAPGKVAAAKLLLERFDKLYRPKGVVEHTGAVGIDEYLKKMARKQLEEEAQAEADAGADCAACPLPEPSVELGKTCSSPAT